MSNPDSSPLVSVVICSKGRHELLSEAVAAVRASDYPVENFEIVVVEESAVPIPLPGVRYVHLPLKNLGVGYCHNRGVDNARGDIIAFTDDDVIVERHWLANLIATFDDPHVMGVAGLVRTQPSTVTGETEEILGLPGGGIRALAASAGRIVPTASLSTCNLAYRRRIFNEFRFLETSFGKFGGDDWYLGQQVAARYKAVYNPSATVYHRPKAKVGRLLHTYYRRQLTDCLYRRDVLGQSRARAVFGKLHQCAIFRALAVLAVVWFGGSAGLLALALAYYLLALASVRRLRPYIRRQASFWMYPTVKFVAESGILKGEIMILLAPAWRFDKILERY